MLIAALSGRDKLTRLNLFAAILSVIGVSLAIGEKAFESSAESSSWHGEALFFLAVTCGATYNAFSSGLLKGQPVAQTTILGMTAGVIFISPVAYAEGLPDVIVSYSAEEWLWILYLAGPAAAISLSLFNWGLQQLSPARAAIYVPLAPVAATAFSAILLGESLSSYFLAGLAFAVAGPLLMGLRKSPQSLLRRSS